jgi:hypothetical protein
MDIRGRENWRFWPPFLAETGGFSPISLDQRPARGPADVEGALLGSRSARRFVIILSSRHLSVFG